MSFFTIFLLYIHTLFSVVDFPQKFTVRELYNYCPSAFTVEDENEVVCFVEREFFQEVREYYLYKRGKAFIARAKCSFSRACSLFTVETSDYGIVGYVEETPSTLSIYDDEKNILATSKTNYWETEILLIDTQGFPLAVLTRPFFREHEGWDLTLYNEEEWNKRNLLWLLVPIIQTDKPFWYEFGLLHDQKAGHVPSSGK